MGSTCEYQMEHRAFIYPEVNSKGKITGTLNVIVRSVKTYAKGRAYGRTQVRLDPGLSRKHRRILIALALRDCRYSYQYRMKYDGVLPSSRL